MLKIDIFLSPILP